MLNAVDGSEDHLIKVWNLVDYSMKEPNDDANNEDWSDDNIYDSDDGTPSENEADSDSDSGEE